MPTVSRSVDRVFQIMGLFGSRRRPLSATEVRESLDMPHSSAVSLLSRMVSLGYLDQNANTKRFFPSLRLSHLCESVPDSITFGSLPAQLADAVHARTDETTSLSRLSDLFTLPVYVRSASYRGGHIVTPGCTGGLATQSVVGQVLLSLQSDSVLKNHIQRSEFWARRSRVSLTQHEAKVMQSVSKVRETGYLCAFDQLLPGIGVVSCPLPLTANGDPLAITLAGPSDRFHRNRDRILATLREEVDRRFGHSQLSIAQSAD